LTGKKWEYEFNATNNHSNSLNAKYAAQMAMG